MVVGPPLPPSYGRLNRVQDKDHIDPKKQVLSLSNPFIRHRFTLSNQIGRFVTDLFGNTDHFLGTIRPSAWACSALSLPSSLPPDDPIGVVKRPPSIPFRSAAQKQLPPSLPLSLFVKSSSDFFLLHEVKGGADDDDDNDDDDAGDGRRPVYSPSLFSLLSLCPSEGHVPKNPADRRADRRRAATIRVSWSRRPRDGRKQT